MTYGNINDPLSEAGCEHNQKQHKAKKDKPCTQFSKPGDAQGNCAFDGAMMTLVPITDAAHLVHGPSGCAGNSWGSRSNLSSGSMLYKIGFTTDIDESNIIFGGAKKLYQAILEVERRYKPAAVFVYSTCITALIGDDINGVCKAAAQKTGTPIIPVNSPGFTGSKNLGSRVAGEALLEHVIGTVEPDLTTPYDINLIGEYNIAGAIWKVVPLLEKLGIRVLGKITGDARYQEICYAHRAKLNVIICSKALLHMARKMEELYGIPYIHESLYTVQDTNTCLRNIAAKFADPNLQERTEKLIAEETAALDEALAPYRQQLTGKRAVLSPEVTKSWSIISAVKHLGMELIATSTLKSTEGSIILEQESSKEILQIINENKADILIADGRYQYTALQARIPFLDINQEHHHLYAGYVGMLEVAQKLYKTLYSPVWGQVCKSAPWETNWASTAHCK